MLATQEKQESCGCGFDLSPTTGLRTLAFELPPTLEAGEPPEARGLRRDQVRLMVSHIGDNRVQHGRFDELEQFLHSGDVLVINTSATMNAALAVVLDDGLQLELHLSTRLPADLWSVEMRQTGEGRNEPYYVARPGTAISLPGGGRAVLHTPYNSDQRDDPAASVRLWIATLELPLPVGDYLAAYGFPIRYSYVKEPWPAEYYQTTYATEFGSAEMPSAGRAFSPEIITRLIAKGVQVAPLILHTGVASLEDHEPPYEEFYRVPQSTADAVNRAHQSGGRVIAVGTTVVRALETVAADNGTVRAGEGYTSLIITPQRTLRAIDALLTGLHEPRATHLAMLEALAGPDHLCETYTQALDNGYLWHEFGDLHLILP